MLDFKTAPPAQRSGLIARDRLLDRISRASEPVVALVAPAGYGKTTLLSQLFSKPDLDAAWLSLDEVDDDTTILLSNLTHSLEQAGFLSAGMPEATVDSGSVLTRGVDRLLDSISTDANALLILDHVDHLSAQSSLDVIGALMTKARGHIQLMITARSHVGLPYGLLRARGDVLEFSVDDLALDVSEAGALLRTVGVGEPETVDAVLRSTEGWPAAVYLTALALRSGAPVPDDTGVNGNDRYLVDYLRQELMKDVSEDLESFLLKSSILPRMSGDLCDYVLETQHSAQTLDRLTDSNLMVIPLDRTRTWYRYHSLLRDYLSSEVEREMGGVTPALHARASEWFEANGHIEFAIEQARLADDHDRVVQLLKRSARLFYSTGRYAVLSSWLSWLEAHDVLGDHPDLAAVGAFARALGGDAGGAQRMSLLAYNDADGRAREDSDLEPFSLLLRAFQAPRGVDRALEDARAADEVLRHNSDWGHTSLAAVALATCAIDGVEAAEPLWTDALWRGESIEARPLVAVARAMRGLIAVRRSKWDEAETHIKSAIAEIEESGLDLYITSCLAYVEASRISAHRGDLEEGRTYLGSAAAIRPLLTFALPIYSVLTLHELAGAYIEFADIGGARRVLRDASDIIALRPRLGTLVDEHQSLRDRLAALPTGTVGPSSLTGAELRLLPLLVTHLTYPEIGERLYISRHTVKTQAMSIYRKLGVSSRSEAVGKAREIGLISR